MLRLSVARDFEKVVVSAEAAFSVRSWPYLRATLLPWLLCSGQRCWTRVASLASHRRSLSGYYRFLSDGKWRLELLFRSLFELIVRTFRLEDLTLVLDDTLCPKWGRTIFGVGYHFDHVGRPRPGYIWGHNWVVLAVVVPMGPGFWVALPFWIGLYRPAKTCGPEEFQTRHEMAVEVLKRARQWFSGPIELLADGAYSNRSLVRPARELEIHMVSRLRSDAALRRPDPPRRARGKRGRPPKHGAPLPRLATLARGSGFADVRVGIYGKMVTLQLREVLAYWPPVDCVIRLVITKDPSNPKRRAYLWTTRLDRSAAEVVESFARRWTIEQLFSVSKNQMGLDSAEVRRERSVIRHAALCLALQTWLEVWAHRFCPRVRGKSFAAKLAALRAESIKQAVFASGPRRKGSPGIARGFGELFATATANR